MAAQHALAFWVPFVAGALLLSVMIAAAWQRWWLYRRFHPKWEMDLTAPLTQILRDARAGDEDAQRVLASGIRDAFHAMLRMHARGMKPTLISPLTGEIVSLSWQRGEQPLTDSLSVLSSECAVSLGMDAARALGKPMFRVRYRIDAETLSDLAAYVTHEEDFAACVAPPFPYSRAEYQAAARHLGATLAQRVDQATDWAAGLPASAPPPMPTQSTTEQQQI